MLVASSAASDDGVDVAWSLGPVFGDDSGLEIAAFAAASDLDIAGNVGPLKLNLSGQALAGEFHLDKGIQGDGFFQ